MLERYLVISGVGRSPLVSKFLYSDKSDRECLFIEVEKTRQKLS
jgi:hypothetical protein